MSSHRTSRPLSCRVYVGQLGNDATQQELEEAFSCFGNLRSVWIARNPPGFAFVEFADPRNAQEAVRALDGSLLCGHTVRVDFADGNSRSSYRPLSKDHRQVICYACGGRGHYARDCSAQDSASTDSEERCYACGERGHYARDCSVQDSSSTDSGERCYACGEEGHYARDCLVRHYQERCYACGERGHYARDCVVQLASSLDLENQSDEQQINPMAYGYRASGGNDSNSRAQQQDRNFRSQQQHRSNRHQEQHTNERPREQYRNDKHKKQSSNNSTQCSHNSISEIPSTSSGSNKHNDTSGDVKCVICLDTVEDQMEYIPCGHGFHAQCCKDWLSIKGACPVCRTGVESRSGNTQNSDEEQIEDDVSDNAPLYFIYSAWLG